MAFDPSKYIDRFRAELEGHLRKLGDGLTSLESDQAKGFPIREMVRAAHTVRGSAGMMAFPHIAELARLMEERFAAAGSGSAALDPEQRSALRGCLEAIARYRDGDSAAGSTEAVRREVAELTGTMERVFQSRRAGS